MGTRPLDELELGLGAGIAGIGAADEFLDDGLGGHLDGLELFGGQAWGALGFLEGDDAHAEVVGPGGGDGDLDGGVVDGLAEGFLEVGDAFGGGRTPGTAGEQEAEADAGEDGEESAAWVEREGVHGERV